MNRRHTFFWALLRPLVILFLMIRFGYRFEKPKALPENYIVLSNHNTDYDPLLVGASFPRQMYFVCSEHLSRWRVFPLLNFAFAPILRYKGTVASSTVMQTLKTVKGGGNVCIFAEGARSWDGVTAPILPSTGKMVKSAKCGLVTYRIQGGYFVSPNWSTSNLRRGHLYGAPVNVYTKEQIEEMSVDQVNEIINRDLYENAYERQKQLPRKYKGKNLAYKLENLLYLCPHCQAIDRLRSSGDTVTCQSCGETFRYDEYGMLHNSGFDNLRDQAAWQKARTDEDVLSGKAYTAGFGILKSIAKKQESVADRGYISMDPTTLTCGDTSFPLSDIGDLAIHGRNALVFSVGRTYYELIPDEGFNALKFMIYFQAVKRNANAPVPV